MADTEVPGELRPIGGFERQILPRDRHSSIGQERPRERHMVIQALDLILLPLLVREHLKREVVIAHHELIGRQGIKGDHQLLSLGDGKFLGTVRACWRWEQPLPRRLGDEGEGLGKDEGKGRR